MPGRTRWSPLGCCRLRSKCPPRRSRPRRRRLQPMPRVTALRRQGALDDERFAQGRAAALAERGLGDAAIRFRLEREGVEPESIEPSLAAIQPERDRALRLAARRGATARTTRWLAARGFAT